MTSLRIALTELRRITAGRLPRLALLATVLVPTLYGGLYLYANHDPYANLDQVPAALVVTDAGAEGPDGERVDAGADVAEELVSAHDFDWHEVGAEAAREGVRDGTYAFALTIPRDFSAALTSSADLDPRQARLRMTTNDANSYLSTTIADNVTDKVRDALAERVSTEAATQFLLGISHLRANLVDAADGAGDLAHGAAEASSGAHDLARGADRLHGGTTRLAGGTQRLANGLDTLADRTGSLPGQTRKLADGARQVADGNAQIAATGREVAAASADARQQYAQARGRLREVMADEGLTRDQRQKVLDVYDSVGTPIRAANARVHATSARLDRLADGADRVAEGNALLAVSTPTLVDGIASADAGARQVATGAGDLDAGAGKLAAGEHRLENGLHRLHGGTGRLRDGLRDGVEQLPAVGADTRDRIAATIGDPVAVDDISQASAGSYGAGLAPFFLSLAAWIGAYVLFLLVRPLSARATAANQTPLRVAFGGWLTPALVGMAQMALLLTTVLLGLGIVPVDVLASVAFLLLVSGTFVAMVHALNAWFGAPGQFLGLVLMVTQLVTAGGTFPWQTIPQPLHWLHHVLPMSYAVDGLRQLMYGGLDTLVLRDCAVLAGYLVVAVGLSAVAARRQRVWTPKRVKPELVL